MAIDPMILNITVLLAPVLLCLVMFERIDAFRLVNLFEIILLLALGAAAAAASYYANGSVLDQFPLGMADYSQTVAPVVEEVLKGLLVIALFAGNRIGYLIDAAIMGFAIGAGFSAAENLFYLHQFAGANMGVWLVRGFGTAIMHGGATAIFAAIAQILYAPRLRQDASRFHFNIFLFLPGLVAAIALHAGFNHFTSAPIQAMAVVLVAVPLTLFVLFAIGETYAHRWLAHNREAHGQLLADIESGVFAATNDGRALQALARRLGERRGKALMEYVHIHAQLVIMADISLLEIEEHLIKKHQAEVHDLFQRLHALERRLGRTAVMAVRQHLKFSRNDIWEMHELEVHAGK
jgi:RsiW-degrading membrane proteinase PrsW (M82 family)